MGTLQRGAARGPVRPPLSIAVLLAAFILGGLRIAPGQEPPADSNAPPQSVSEVHGQLPLDMRGVWLLVADGMVAGKIHRATVELYAIEEKGGRLDARLLLVALPKPIRDAIDDANRRQVAWQPSDPDLELLRRDLEDLEPVDPMRYVKHTVRLTGQDAFESILKPELLGTVEGAAFTLETEHDYRPNWSEERQGGQLITDRAILAVRKVDPLPLEGEQSRVIVAAGFAPVPVALKGPFWLYRLRAPGEAPAGGLGAAVRRVLHSLTRGCSSSH